MRDPQGYQPESGPSKRRLLVVEPEALLRWSLATYLGRWFTVIAAESERAAIRRLEAERIDAVVLSDDLSDEGAKRVEALARSQNGNVRIVGTVTQPSCYSPNAKDEQYLEKPFDLAVLAHLLGVGGQTVSK